MNIRRKCDDFNLKCDNAKLNSGLLESLGSLGQREKVLLKTAKKGVSLGLFVTNVINMAIVFKININVCSSQLHKRQSS